MPELLILISAILLSLLVDYLITRRILKETVGKSILVTVIANIAASASTFVLLIIFNWLPIGMFSWSFFWVLMCTLLVLVFLLVKTVALFTFNKTSEWKKIRKVAVFGTILFWIPLVASFMIIGSMTSPRQGNERNAAIKSSMDTLRVVAELQYDDTGSYDAVCSEHNGTVSTLSTAGEFGRIASAVAFKSGAVPSCSASTIGTPVAVPYYVAWATLVNSKEGKYFCVDSAGFARAVNIAPKAGDSACP